MSSVRTLVATIATTLCLVAAGCTSTDAVDTQPSPKPSGPSKTPSSAASQHVDLDFAVYGEAREIKSYVDLADAFMKAHPNITVTVGQSPDDDAAMSNLDNRFVQGNSPDVFLMQQDDLPGLMAEHRVQPVDQLLEDRQVDFGDGYQRDALEAFSADSALQCMPNDVSPLVVYYNKKLLNLRSLVPKGDDPPNAVDGWTWDQFSRAANEMSRGRTKGVYVKPSLEEFAPFIWSGGGDLVDDNVAPTTLTLSDGDSREALEQVLTLARDPELTPTRAELDRLEAVDRFKQGRIGMILGTRAITPELRKAKKLDFEVMPLPSIGLYKTATDMSGYCISPRTQNLQAAADFLAFAVGRKGATITSKSGYVVPSNLPVAHSRAFVQPGRRPSHAFVFNEAVRGAETMPFTPQWPQVVEQSRPSLEKMFYAPVIDLEALLERIDTSSQPLFVPDNASPPAQ